METGRRPEFGVCAAVDVHYLRTGGARAAAVLAADAAFAHVLAERTAVIPRVRPYRPGQFYLRELPPLRAVLDGLSRLGLLVVDGYADLDPGGRPGLGAHAHAEFGIPVIGVAKSCVVPEVCLACELQRCTGSAAGMMISHVPPSALSDLHPGLRLAGPARPLIGVEERGTAGTAA